jgi:hypothetical protein
MRPDEHSEPDGTAVLSLEGARRREEILQHAAGALQRRRMRRRGRQIAAAGAAALIALAAAVYVLPREGHAPHAPIAELPERSAPPAPRQADDASPVPARSLRVVVVHNDPTILERSRISGNARPVVHIDDDELLHLLAEAGRPEGLIRAGGRVMLTSEVQAAAKRQRALPGSG